jgi:hypothetical protein
VKRRVITHTPFEKGNPEETPETQNHRAKRSSTPRSTLAGLPKVRKPIKLSKGGPYANPNAKGPPLHLTTP